MDDSVTQGQVSRADHPQHQDGGYPQEDSGDASGDV